MKLDKVRIRKVDYYDEYGEFSYCHYLIEYEAKFLWFYRYWRTVKDYIGTIAGTFTENKTFNTIDAAEEYIANERKKVKPKKENYQQFKSISEIDTSASDSNYSYFQDLQYITETV